MGLSSAAVEKMAPWQHLTNRKLRLREVKTLSHGHHSEQAAKRDLRLVTVQPYLAKTPPHGQSTRCVGVWLMADMQLLDLFGVCEYRIIQ